MAEFVIIAGLSGAGRSEAAKHFDDLGWFVIDNLPPSLIPKVTELALAPGSQIDRVALVVGTAEYREETLPAIGVLRAVTGASVRTLFLQTRTPELVRRYETTRRRHPFDPSASLAAAIESEREALEPIKAAADLIIDTSDLNVHELRDRIIENFGGENAANRMQTRVMSFGFKHGIPLDVDLVIDCRFLPNPHWVDNLRPLTGLDQPVKDYVLEQPITAGFLESMGSLLHTVMPAYASEGKAYLTIALGCTGGHHRSVVIAEQIGTVLTSLGFPPAITHRDIER
ncbi:MAG: RNase adapter RapZ [Acidimicrobiales bacterium]